MANATSNPTISGGRTRIAHFATRGKLTIDTYVAGGVDLLTLVAASANFQAAKLKKADIMDAIVHTKADTEGLKYIPKFNRETGKVILIALATGAELAGGSITPVEVEYTLFSQ